MHMGAWANASIVPDARTYGDNTAGTYNVFQACADLGVRRVVLEVETRELLARYCPSTEVREGLVGAAAPLSCQKAHSAFGYQPRYAWSEHTYHLEDNE